jgi:cold-inducible RNA-binding protein
MKIRLGNLSSDTTVEDLRMLLECFGQVADVRLDRFPGQATAEMPNKTTAREAIEGLDGQNLKGRDLEVSEMQERTGSRRGGRAGGGGGRRRRR